MGRPLNKHKLHTIVGFYNNGEDVYYSRIIKQKGSKKFEMADGNFYHLVPKDKEELVAGEMTIYAHLPNDDVLSIAKITSRKLTASDGNVYGWTTSDSKITPADGYVWVESFQWWD